MPRSSTNIVCEPYAAAKRLKIWNGRGGNWREVEYVYVCASSQRDAVTLVTQAGHPMMTQYELRVYWQEGCWGNPMKGIKQERGVWVQRGDWKSPVERLI